MTKTPLVLVVHAETSDEEEENGRSQDSFGVGDIVRKIRSITEKPVEKETYTGDSKVFKLGNNS